MSATDLKKCIGILADLVCVKICSHLLPNTKKETEEEVKSNKTDTSSIGTCSCNDDINDVIKTHLEDLKLVLHLCLMP